MGNDHYKKKALIVEQLVFINNTGIVCRIVWRKGIFKIITFLPPFSPTAYFQTIHIRLWVNN